MRALLPVAALLSLVACGASPGVVRILEINDIHVRDERSTAYPSRVVAAMNREEADLVLVCGDVATDGKEEELLEARRVLDGLSTPYHVVIGNHDAGESDDSAFRRVFRQAETTYGFESHGIHFVAIDPGCGKDYTKNAVRPDVLDRLRAIAARIPGDRPLILFSHYPYGSGVTYRTPNAAEVLEVFRGKRLLAVVSGHWHGNTERRECGVLFTTTACASSTRPNHDKTEAKGYRVLTVRDGREIETEFRAVPAQDSRTIRVGPAEGGPAIQKAVQALREGGTLVLLEGEYRLSRGIRLDRVRGFAIRAERKVRLVLEPAPVVALRSAADAGARRILVEKPDGLYAGAELEFVGPPWKGTPALRVTALGPDGTVDLSVPLPDALEAGAKAMVLENLLHLTEVEDVTISGLELDLQRDRQPFAPVNHTRQCGILVTAPYNHEKGTSSPSRRVRILDCSVRNAHHRGIALYAAEDSEVARCRVEAVGAEGIDLDHYCRRVRVDACRVSGAGLSGIEINDGADCTVQGSAVERCPTGIKVWHYLPCRMEGANRGNRVLGNTVRASGAAGIWMGKDVDGNTVEGNTIEGVERGPGIFLQGKGNVVRGNAIREAQAVVDRGEDNDVRP